MSAPNILITGGSGYLGGSLLQQLKETTDLPAHGTVYALVRSAEQARQVTESYAAEPLTLDLTDGPGLTQALLDREISVVFYLINARESGDQLRFIEALAAVQRKTGRPAHFLHTTGAKLLSRFTGFPTDHAYTDDDGDLLDMQKTLKGPYPPMQEGAQTNIDVIEAAEKHGIRAYIYIPCIVYGKGTGFGNPISIQTVAIVKAAKALRKVIDVNKGEEAIWPVCHIHDNTTLYVQLLRKMLSGETIGHNRNGYYLASPGSVPWADIYAAMGKALAKRGVVDDAAVMNEPGDADLQVAGDALGCDKAMVEVMMGGVSRLVANHGKSIGWTPKYSPQHVLEAADDEVELILQNI